MATKTTVRAVSYDDSPIPFEPRDYANEHRLSGRVTRLFCERDDWCAGILSVDHGDPLVKDCRFAVRDHVSLNEHVTLRGKWEENRYGWQFQSDGLEYAAPDMTTEGLARYLATEQEFRGLGPVKARLIATEFGADFDTVIRNEPERVAEVGKLTLAQIDALQSAWCERQDINAISAWLGEYGLTAGQIRKIAQEFGNLARRVLEENPYVIHERITGIGFQRNDEIALKMGTAPMSPARIRAGICFIVQQAHQDSGHTYIPRQELVTAVVRGLYLDDLQAAALVSEQIDALAEADAIVTVTIGTGDTAREFVGAMDLYRQETELLRWLTTPAADTSAGPVGPVDYTAVDPVEVGLDTLTDEQRAAVDSALRYPVTVMTGGAGTGKSHTIKRIIETLRAVEIDAVDVAAPTGKAARRLQQDRVQAQTIHRLLAYDPRQGRFTRNADNPLTSECVIIDEVSMCAVPLLHALCSAIDFTRTRLVLVGDYNQLPPIGPGNTLRDMVDNQLVPVTRLTHCHRNAGQLKVNCNNILRGAVAGATATIDKSTAPSDTMLQALPDSLQSWQVVTNAVDPTEVVRLLCLLQTEMFPQWGFHPLQDCQFITPQNPGPLGVNRLNLELQRAYQRTIGTTLPPVADSKARPAILVGDKVMQVKNNYQYEGGLMNGTQGVVLDITRHEDPAEVGTRNEGREREFLRIQFDDRPEPLDIRRDDNNLVLAYAVTCHKVQGSQYPCVVSVVHKAHTYMLSRGLLYTAVSRARYTSIIVGEPVGIRRAVATVKDTERRTWTALLARANANANANSNARRTDSEPQSEPQQEATGEHQHTNAV